VSKVIPTTNLPFAVLFSLSSQRNGLPVLILRVTQNMNIKVHLITGHEGPEEE